ncbi:MAG: hypothetical protein KKB82_00985 [Candidatus Omnitrophica bacterium]|nr:hypothetical protein [Candidatus Omnitrophota bacterium]MBU1924476.1 hypothetical protein [Candidatus Omnitrophota bacterium]
MLDPRAEFPDIQNYLLPADIISLMEAIEIATANGVPYVFDARLGYTPENGFFYSIQGLAENKTSHIGLLINADTKELIPPLSFVSSCTPSISFAEAVLLAEKLSDGKVLDARIDTIMFSPVDFKIVYYLTVTQKSPPAIKLVCLDAEKGALIPYVAGYTPQFLQENQKSALDALKLLDPKNKRTPVAISLIDNNGVPNYKIIFENELFLPSNEVLVDAKRGKIFQAPEN